MKVAPRNSQAALAYETAKRHWPTKQPSDTEPKGGARAGFVGFKRGRSRVPKAPPVWPRGGARAGLYTCYKGRNKALGVPTRNPWGGKYLLWLFVIMFVIHFVIHSCCINEMSAPAVAGAYCRGRYALRAHCMWHSSDRLIVCRPPKNVCDSSAMHLATQLAMHLLYAISRRDES